MIDVDDVSVELGGSTILSDVSLSVEAGQFLALVGPNGAGKTTLLRTINGLLSPTGGRVRIDGSEIDALSAKRTGRLVATVPQETTLSFDFPVEDVVTMGRTPHRSRFSTASTDDQTAVEVAMERTDTTRFAERLVGELSGGERQRVLLARALAQETPALLLDEPTASLDINHQVATLSLARELAEDGKAVVAAIHDLELAARFCDSVALLSEGSLLATGSPSEVLEAGRLERAFDVRTAVTTNPVTGTRAVTPLSDVPPGERRVHVLGHGERTARVVGRLADAGIEVTVGVLPAGDVATATARSIASEFVTAPPFEEISTERRRAVSELIERADATVLAGPLEGVNAAVAAESDVLVALEGTEPPAGTPTVETTGLLDALRELPTTQPTTRP